MVASKKPTGDLDCPVWIREAKQANMMIKDRAHSIPFVDDNEEEMRSDDDQYVFCSIFITPPLSIYMLLTLGLSLLRNGVGNPIPLSPGDPGYTQGTLISGWSGTQSQPGRRKQQLACRVCQVFPIFGSPFDYGQSGLNLREGNDAAIPEYD
jgi:hypothetical protein